MISLETTRRQASQPQNPSPPAGIANNSRVQNSGSMPTRIRALPTTNLSHRIPWIPFTCIRSLFRMRLAAYEFRAHPNILRRLSKMTDDSEYKSLSRFWSRGLRTFLRTNSQTTKRVYIQNLARQYFEINEAKLLNARQSGNIRARDTLTKLHLIMNPQNPEVNDNIQLPFNDDSNALNDNSPSNHIEPNEVYNEPPPSYSEAMASDNEPPPPYPGLPVSTYTPAQHHNMNLGAHMIELPEEAEEMRLNSIRFS